MLTLPLTPRVRVRPACGSTLASLAHFVSRRFRAGRGRGTSVLHEFSDSLTGDVLRFGASLCRAFRVTIVACVPYATLPNKSTQRMGATVRLLNFRSPRRETVVCGILCFVTALLSLGIFMLQDGGAFTLREDFDFQQIPFTMALHNQIARGGLLGWCWNLDLGTSAIQGFSFYELGSPFFWTSMLFPADAFPFVVGWIYILKYVVAGITSRLFIRRFVHSEHVATLGALLYAFSGFQTANLLFYHFHDVVALFPLLLIGLERLMEDERDLICFVMAVCINALVNYFFFVQDVIFLLLYFGIRFAPTLAHKGVATLARCTLRCLLLGILGSAMAAALLVPSGIYMMGNPRTGSSTLSVENLLWDPQQALFQLQGILLPADAMFDHNAVIAQQWTSTSCWLPLVGPSLCLAYLKGRLGKKDWLARLLIVLLIVCASPLLSSAFILFTGIYQRWWYLLVLMGALASAQVLDDPRSFSIRFGALAYAILLLAFVGIVLACANLADPAYLLHADRFALYVGIALAGCAATYLLTNNSQRKQDGALTQLPSQRKKALLAVVAVACATTTALTTFYYRQNPYTGEMLEHIEPNQWRDTLTQIRLGTQLRTQDPQYRYATCDNRLTLTGNAIGTSSFNSTISNAVGRFEEFFGWGAWNVWNLNKESIPGLSELLGGRYVITHDPGSDPAAAQYAVDGSTVYVIEKGACPIGFMCDRYAITDKVYELPVEQRALALLQAPVVSPASESQVSAFAQKIDPSDIDGSADVSQLTAQARSRTVRDFWRDDHGFGFSASTPSPALVYLAVPHDDGWTAIVDGAEVATVDSAGMTLLPIEAGDHEVRFSYETPGAKLGLVVSAVAWATFALVCWLTRRRSR